ncbi:BCCT family transporter [Peribacillus butanolivorans]|uniref:BCCT family transporter n=1 Tax=Peribacillus butanolivorans TaxID=421767 RepID=UPI00207CBF0F|nr:BCCT family transporter [Peribacillus butanolivorans]MCO0597784.1 BCCT family transporter [Peribacillus butanolivorans]
MKKSSAFTNSVFIVSFLIVSLFIIWGLCFNDQLAVISGTILKATLVQFDWFYVGAVFLFLLFSIVLPFTRYGSVRLGQEKDRPEFKTGSWIAMLFSAGMGVGIMFYGVAEPVMHYSAPPVGEGFTENAARTAMKYSYFHWGLHAWAIYTVIGLALAYFQYKKQLPALVSSAFYPVLKERIHGPIGKAIDILAVTTTVFGVATSLGLGSMQISSGIEYVFAIPKTTSVSVTVIVVTTVLFLISASTGLKRGIRYLSNSTVILSLVLMAIVLALGPTVNILRIFFQTTGSYLNDLLSMSLRLEPFHKDTWISSWTVFYWAVWISWGPAVGMFIARISRGRTIREFILGVLIAPSLGCFAWFSIFGGTAIDFIHNGGNKALASAITADVSLALFELFKYMPLSTMLSIIGFILIVFYYITLADASTYVLGMISEKGNENPSLLIKITWGVIQALVAISLLLAGGLETIQTIAVVTAFPFTGIIIWMCVSFLKGLKENAISDDTGEVEMHSERKSKSVGQ